MQWLESQGSNAAAFAGWNTLKHGTSIYCFSCGVSTPSTNTKDFDSDLGACYVMLHGSPKTSSERPSTLNAFKPWGPDFSIRRLQSRLKFGPVKSLQLPKPLKPWTMCRSSSGAASAPVAVCATPSCAHKICLGFTCTVAAACDCLAKLIFQFHRH